MHGGRRAAHTGGRLRTHRQHRFGRRPAAEPDRHPGTAAKHALVGLTKQLSQDFGRFGITCNAVAPGFVRSNPTTERQWEAYGAEGQARLVESIHTRRLGTADDVASAALFFASEQANWISGQILSVDGGRS